jgi:uncharacterized sulfatase
MPFLSHAQPNQYKDGKSITKTMRRLYQEGKLDVLQTQVFRPTRPVEELYDLETDPYETINLSNDSEYQQTLCSLRKRLEDWMVASRDLGLIPEPVLEELGRECGNKMVVLADPKHHGLNQRLLQVIKSGEQGDVPALLAALGSPHAAVRYWAAVGLGNTGDRSAIDVLRQRTEDPSHGVRVAVAFALCQLGEVAQGRAILEKEIENENLIVGMYAIRALERIGDNARPALATIERARNSPYEFTRRVARRLTTKLDQ